jgi:hypothetical protein
MTFCLKTALFSLFFGDSGREYRTRNGLRVFFGGLVPKCIYPRVTGILIPISTHPTVQCTMYGLSLDITESEKFLSAFQPE